MMADVFPGRDSTNGANKYTNLAFDATYQYMANPRHIFEGKTTYIYEDQRLTADRGAGTNKTYLNTFKLNLAYTFDQTYGLTFAYNKINGSHDLPNTVPNSEYFTAELVYVPFGKSSSYLQPWLNLRTSLQYIGYSQANSTSTAAQDNNTFMLNGVGWLFNFNYPPRVLVFFYTGTRLLENMSQGQYNRFSKHQVIDCRLKTGISI